MQSSSRKKATNRLNSQAVIWCVLLVSGILGNLILWRQSLAFDTSLVVSWTRFVGIAPMASSAMGKTISLADPNHFAEFTNGKSGPTGIKSMLSATNKQNNNVIVDDISIKKSFSFCLILKDDNDILNEWIAYHYYTLHMRKLIVTIDPSSKTTPEPLLEVWKQEFGLNYEIWNDSNFTEPWFYLDKDYDRVPRQVKWEDKDAAKWQEEGADVSYAQRLKDVRVISIHRYRQKRFLHRCEQYLQEEGYSWMTHIDTDEYIVVSPVVLRKRKRMKQKKVMLNESDAIYHFLQQVKTNELVNYPCISLPRVLYGSVEDPDAPPTSYEAKQMESLRWKYRTRYDDDALNKQPKVIMDVSGFPPIEEYVEYQKTFSIHRPDFGLCRAQGQMNVKDGQRFPFTINHYLGSLERYMARNDTRRTQTQYNQKANVQDGKDGGWIDAWWPGFLKQYGRDKVVKVMGRYMDPSEYGAEARNDIIQKEHQAYAPPAFDSTLYEESQPEISLTADRQSSGGRLKPPKLGISLPLEQDSFSVCMLIKDDNDILSEWIAYHYHTLKLRYLVVATDPSSTTDPSVVLDRWRDRIEIEDWSDASYMPDYFVQGDFGAVPNMLGLGNSSTARNTMNLTEALEFHGVSDPQEKEEQTQVNNHRFRQMNFFESCIRDLMQKNKTWMAHIDTDEYITLSHLVKPQSEWRTLPVPLLETPGSLLDFLKKAAINHRSGMSYPCISMPRLLYGSKQNDAVSASKSTIRDTFDRSKFETLKWKYHSDYDNAIGVNGRPKVILDLSGIPPRSKFLEHTVWSIHRPGLRMCRPDREVRFDDKPRFPLIVQHYLGSWERYSHRSDARRSREKYNAKNDETTIEDNDWIDGWVEHFANAEGIENAKRLLAEYVI